VAVEDRRVGAREVLLGFPCREAGGVERGQGGDASVAVLLFLFIYYFDVFFAELIDFFFFLLFSVSTKKRPSSLPDTASSPCWSPRPSSAAPARRAVAGAEAGRR